MIVRSFKSVLGVGAVAGAALCCYMVSLRVASERASLDRVESRILMAKRDIRALDTELVTRGRIRQLERWNTDVLALAAPTEAQFLENEAQLAGLTRVDAVEAAPIVMAAAKVEQDRDADDKPRVVLATYRTDGTERPARLVRASAPKLREADAKREPRKPAAKKVAAEKAAQPKPETAAKPNAIRRTKVAMKSKATVSDKAAARAKPAAKTKVAVRGSTAGKAKPGKGL